MVDCTKKRTLKRTYQELMDSKEILGDLKISFPTISAKSSKAVKNLTKCVWYHTAIVFHFHWCSCPYPAWWSMLYLVLVPVWYTFLGIFNLAVGRYIKLSVLLGNNFHFLVSLTNFPWPRSWHESFFSHPGSNPLFIGTLCSDYCAFGSAPPGEHHSAVADPSLRTSRVRPHIVNSLPLCWATFVCNTALVAVPYTDILLYNPPSPPMLSTCWHIDQRHFRSCVKVLLDFLGTTMCER